MKRNIFLNLIAIQSDNSERLKDFVNKWVDSSVGQGYPINFVKYFGVDDRYIPTAEETAAYDLLSNLDMLKSSYLDLEDNLLLSTIDTIQSTFATISHNLSERSDVNPIVGAVQHIGRMVDDLKAKWEDDEYRKEQVVLIISEFGGLLKRVRRMSVNVTLFDFEPFNTVEELDDFEKPDETLLALFSILLTNQELAEENLECLGSFLDDNTYVLALPSKNDSMVDFVHDISDKYNFQVNLYFGDANVSGHIVSDSGHTEYDYKEPEFRTVKMLLDAVGLDEEELTYFKYHRELMDEAEEIDPVEEGAFGVN